MQLIFSHELILALFWLCVAGLSVFVVALMKAGVMLLVMVDSQSTKDVTGLAKGSKA